MSGRQHVSACCRALSDDSAGLRSAMDTLLHFEEQGQRMLTHMLGSSFTLQDLLWHAAAAAAVLAVASAPQSHSARLPLVLLLVADILLERLVAEHLGHRMQMDPAGQVSVLACSLVTACGCQTLPAWQMGDKVRSPSTGC